MKILLPGGSGLLGRILLRAWIHEDFDCVVLARDVSRTGTRLARLGLPRNPKIVFWDGKTSGEWCNEIQSADAVINLAGRSVNCRYNAANLLEMLHSRIESTRAIGQAIAAADNPPKVWINSSTATIYAHALPGDPARDEATGPIGGNESDVPQLWKRSVDIAIAWERELFNAHTPHTRKIALRSAMVMSPDQHGVFDAFAGLCRLRLGRHGSGKQFVSWIHEYDFVRAVKFLLKNENLSGPVNLAAPGALPNSDFVQAICEAMGQNFHQTFPAPQWLLEAGAFIRRTETELLLKSRRVYPGRLLDAGFVFQQPDWENASKELINRWKTNF